MKPQPPYIRGGSGSREALVFPGANVLFKPLDRISDPARFARRIARLIPSHRFTILGYAGSSFEDIVQDATRAISKTPDVLLGISFGGFVAMRFAASQPELARRMVLLVSAHRFSTGGWRLMERQFESLERGDLHSVVRENSLLFRRPWYNWLLRLKLWTDRNALNAGFRSPGAILSDYRQLFGDGFKRNADYCRRIAAPTLVIGGAADQYFDLASFQETASLIPNGKLRCFERETHMLPLECSSKVAGAITDFL